MMDRTFGAEITPGGTRFRLWAPLAKKAAALILNHAGQAVRIVELGPQARGWFMGLDASGKAGDRYKLRLDEGSPIPDPTSRWQPEGVHGPSAVIDPNAYAWRDQNWSRPPFRDLVIYELHVGTFTPAGTFMGAISKLPHLSSLGVNAVEIMPIAEFAGQRNWGYDGVSLFAPEHAYGHPDDLRAFVDAAHELGIAVILDVVYNHFGPDGNNLAICIGEYLDETAKTPWGGAIRYGHVDFGPLRHMTIANVEYWMREFHIDGFRLDATHAIVDASPHHLLQEITTTIHERCGYAIAEDSRNDVSLIMPVEARGYGLDAVWADDFHHVVRVAQTHEGESYFGDFQGTPDELGTTLEHGWLYMGQTSPVTHKKRGTLCQQAPPQAFVHCISNHDQTGNHPFGKRFGHMVSADATRAAAALLCLSPYTPMLFMGQEWDASTPFLFFVDHKPELNALIVRGRQEEFKHFAAFSDPASLAQIPPADDPATFSRSKLNWDELARPYHAEMLALYRACLGMRRKHAAFRPASRDNWRVRVVGNGVCLLLITCPTEDWLIVFDLMGGHSGSVLEAFGPGVCGRPWELKISSSEERFGGQGASGYAGEGMHFSFEAPETLVFVARAALPET